MVHEDKSDTHSALKKRSHAWIDARSRDLAIATVNKIRADIDLFGKARENLARWRERMDPLPQSLAEWEEILAARSREEVLAILVADDDEGRRLRQSSPFVGVLSQTERKAIFERYESVGA